MPSGILGADVNFPNLKAEGMGTKEKLEKIESYLYMLLENLRYSMGNLGAKNFNEKELDNIAKMITQPVYIELKGVDDKITQMNATADGVFVKVQAAEEHINTLTVTAEQTYNKISDAEGNINTMVSTAEVTAQKISDAEGNINTLTQTATATAQKISDAEGNINTMTQTAEATASKISDAEGNISVMQQNAAALYTQFTGADGRLTAVEASIDGLTVRDQYGVTRINGGMVDTTYLNVNAANVRGILAASNVSMSGLFTFGTAYETYGYMGNGTWGGAQRIGITSPVIGGYSYGCIASSGGAGLEAMQGGTSVAVAKIWVTKDGCYSSSTMQVYSDKRLKNSVDYDMEKYEGVFEGLKPCSYLMNNDVSGKRHWGFLADDLKKELEDEGMQSESAAVLGYDGEYYSIGYTELIALNTHMIQKLMRRMDILEGK